MKQHGIFEGIKKVDGSQQESCYLSIEQHIALQDGPLDPAPEHSILVELLWSGSRPSKIPDSFRSETREKTVFEILTVGIK